MTTTVQVKETSEEEVVVDETVAYPFSTDYGFERYLKRGKHCFKKVNQMSASSDSITINVASVAPDSQKLFLHKSVSRWKPSRETLLKWVECLRLAPSLRLERSGCIITLIQPNTKRPGRTFHNREKTRGKYSYNDGLSYAAIVLLAGGFAPLNEHDEASHLCGHPRCHRISHLIWEPLGVNSSRNECHHYAVQCQHNPRCIPLDVADRLRVQHAVHTQKTEKNSKKIQ